MINWYHNEFNQRRAQLYLNQATMKRDAMYASRKLGKKENLLEFKVNFNDITMRELGLDIDENNHVYNIETESIYQIKEKFIKYSDEEYPVIRANEMDMNLIENPRLMEILFGIYITDWCNRKGYEFTSYYQSAIRGSNKGFFVVTYNINGESSEIKSDVFVNESVRIFNLITKINHTTHLYDLENFDIEILRKDRR